MRSSTFARGTLLAAGLLLATPAVGLAKPKPAAAKLAKKGKKLIKKKKYDRAIELLDQAYAADPAPAFLLLLGTAWQKKGDLPRAHEILTRHAEEAAGDKKARKKGAKLLRKVEAGLKKGWALAKVSSVPDGAALVLVCGERKVEAKTPWEGWLKPGECKVTLTKDGHEPHEAALKLTPGEPGELKAELAEVKPPEPEPEPEPEPVEEEPPPPPPPPPPPADYSLPAMATMGAGVALLAGGSVFGVLNQAAKDRLEASKTRAVTRAELDEDSEAADSHALAANVLLGLGTAAVVTAGVLWLLGDEEEPAEGAGGDAAAPPAWRVRLAPAGVVVEGSL